MSTLSTRIWSIHPRNLEPTFLMNQWRYCHYCIEQYKKGVVKKMKLARLNSEYTIAEIAALTWLQLSLYGIRYDLTTLPKRIPDELVEPVEITNNQVAYEVALLETYSGLFNYMNGIEINPMFKVVPGLVEPWEKMETVPKKKYYAWRNKFGIS